MILDGKALDAVTSTLIAELDNQRRQLITILDGAGIRNRQALHDLVDSIYGHVVVLDVLHGSIKVAAQNAVEQALNQPVDGVGVSDTADAVVQPAG
jgi:hypothetical protein